jgi:trimethylamine--corrinoid protein Co-methyltransferase
MTWQGYTCQKPLDVLTQDQVAQIHDGAMQVLETTGVVFDSNQAVQILEAGGCSVERSGNRVRFPARLVKECVSQCPNSFTIRARNPRFDLTLGYPRVSFMSCPGLFLLDLNTGARRQALLRDVGPLVRLLDALDHIHLAFMPVGSVVDKPEAVVFEHITAEVMRNTEKVGIGANFQGSAKWIIEMCRVTNQQVRTAMSPTSPLTYRRHTLEGGLLFAGAGFPVLICPGILMGASGPVTLAGTLVQQTAEQLAGATLLQLAVPGTPVMFGSYAHLMDMRTASPSIGSVEIGLLGAALAQMARFYGVPSQSSFPWTDSKALDEQAAFEKSMQLVLCGLAGTSLISNGGGLEAERLWSPVQVVIDNELNGMMGRILNGVRVTDETLAMNLIQDVGPLPGNFLKTHHTRTQWKSEQFVPRLADRLNYESWAQQGSKDVVVKAAESAKEIMRTHQVPPLTEEQDRELDWILQEAETEKLQR